MKRYIALILALLMIVSLIGCDKEKTSETGEEKTAEIGETYSGYTGVSIEIEHLNVSKDAYVKINWQNDTPYDVIFGEWYVIQREVDGEWCSCATTDVSFSDIACILKPGTVPQTYTFGKYFNISKSGKYRFRSECYVQISESQPEHCIVWAEFSIK